MASNGFTNAMNAAAQPNATNQESAHGALPQRNAGSNTSNDANSKPSAQAAAGTADDALNGAASVAASDATSIDAGAPSSNGTTPDKTTGKSRSAAAGATATANAPATLAMLLAAAGMQSTAPGSPSPANKAVDSSDSADDQGAAAQSVAAQSIAAMVATAGFASAAMPALAGQASAAIAGPAAATGVTLSASAAKPASGSQSAADAAVIKFDALMTSESGDSSSDGTSLLQTKPDTSDSLPTPSGATGSMIGSNAMPEMVRGLVASTSQTAGAAGTIAVPISDRNWSSAVAAQVQWQVNSNVQSATLQLSPDHLGPLEVRIDVQSSQVNVSFSANHADTRAALEQSVPRLREILANGGLTLGQTSVQQEARSGSQFTPPTSRAASSESHNVEPISISSTRAIGLIDEYA
jgi:flagellar hook-length control protein FliK